MSIKSAQITLQSAYICRANQEEALKISVHKNHFKSRAQAYDEIEAAGHYVMEMDIPAVCNDSHWHHFSTWIYVLEGELHITDAAQERTLIAPAGSRVDVPRRTLHSEKSEGYKIIAGLTVDPSTLTGEIDLPPGEL